MAYKDTTWHTVSFGDTPSNTSPYPFQLSMATLNGFLFMAYKSNVDRLHLFNGTAMTRAGLAASGAPSVADTGAAGTFSGTRYYRTRFVHISGSTVLRRSEPSATTTFSPSGTKTGAVVTEPSYTEDATHWETEASTDNANFYRIAQTVIATTTFTDTRAYSVGYGTTAGDVLSEDSGDYTVWPSVRFLFVADDRLFGLSSFESESAMSTVRWSVVGSDTEGVGNYERVPLDTNNILNLNPSNGGAITGGICVGGMIFVSKYSHLYKLVKTGLREKAYEAQEISTTIGALEGSLVEGTDERGNAALYGVDPKLGPWRYGGGGLQRCGLDIYDSFRTRNLDATQVKSRSVFYPDKQKAYFFLPVGTNVPNFGLTLQTDLTVQREDGIRLGWGQYTGDSAAVLAACLFATNIEAGAARTLDMKPFVAIGNEVHILDTGTTDDGVAFTPQIITGPILTTGTPAIKHGIRAGELVATAVSGGQVKVTLIRNFGEETATGVSTSLAPAGTETVKMNTLDDLKMSELKAVQAKIEDGASNSATWNLHRLDLTPRAEESN
jgi:hypothetical protein